MQKWVLLLLILIIIPIGFALSTNSSSYQANIVVGATGGRTTSATYALDVLMGQPVAGEITSASYLGYLGFFYSAFYGDTSNSPPNAPVLTSPANSSQSTVDRTPLFQWNAASDPDNDPLTYHIQVSLVENFASFVYNVSDVGDLFYLVPANLDIESPYKSHFWRVRANDGTVYGDYSLIRNYSLYTSKSISFTIDNVDFKSLGPDQMNDTTDDSPSPFVLRNDGNIDINISINTSASPFSTETLNKKYFQAKTSDYEASTIKDIPGSQTSWMNLTDTATDFIKEMDWEDDNDEVRIDINVTIPNKEPVGAKKATLTLETE
jgi:hypothetical protein